MKLVSIFYRGQTCLGRIEGSDVIPFDFEGGMLRLIQAGEAGLEYAQSVEEEKVPIDEIILQAPIKNPSKILAIGLNYRDHADEGKAELPKNPLCFTKFPNAIIGPGEEIKWSVQLTQEVDYEAELVVIIGKEAKGVSEEDALNYVFGYTCGNDVSARDLQFSDGQWVRGKSLDTFAPLGPWIVTAEEIPNPQKLALRCVVNGETLQESNTSYMIFGVAYLVHFYSQVFTLFPGDVIYSGTPSGVGIFRSPPRLLADGDEVTIEVEGIGKLENLCRTV